MANNRLYLYCTECHDAIGIGSRLGGPYHLTRETSEIENFLADHTWCCGDVILCEEFGDCESITGKELPDEAYEKWRIKREAQNAQSS